MHGKYRPVSQRCRPREQMRPIFVGKLAQQEATDMRLNVWKRQPGGKKGEHRMSRDKTKMSSGCRLQQARPSSKELGSGLCVGCGFLRCWSVGVVKCVGCSGPRVLKCSCTNRDWGTERGWEGAPGEQLPKPEPAPRKGLVREVLQVTSGLFVCSIELCCQSASPRAFCFFFGLVALLSPAFLQSPTHT